MIIWFIVLLFSALYSLSSFFGWNWSSFNEVLCGIFSTIWEFDNAIYFMEYLFLLHHLGMNGGKKVSWHKNFLVVWILNGWLSFYFMANGSIWTLGCICLTIMALAYLSTTTIFWCIGILRNWGPDYLVVDWAIVSIWICVCARMHIHILIDLQNFLRKFETKKGKK